MLILIKLAAFLVDLSRSLFSLKLKTDSNEVRYFDHWTLCFIQKLQHIFLKAIFCVCDYTIIVVTPQGHQALYAQIQKAPTFLAKILIRQVIMMLLAKLSPSDQYVGDLFAVWQAHLYPIIFQVIILLALSCCLRKFKSGSMNTNKERDRSDVKLKTSIQQIRHWSQWLGLFLYVLACDNLWSWCCELLKVRLCPRMVKHALRSAHWTSSPRGPPLSTMASKRWPTCPAKAPG